MKKPAHLSEKDAKLFAELLLKEVPDSVIYKISKGGTDSIQYNRTEINLLGNKHEYTINLPEGKLQVSLQLYYNLNGHYRLFCFTKINGVQGMAFSINLTTTKVGTEILLRQKIKFTEQYPELLPQEARNYRKQKQEEFCALLNKSGFTVTDRNLSLGTLDLVKKAIKYENNFLNDFLLVSVLKGHFQGNKGYQLKDINKLKRIYG